MTTSTVGLKKLQQLNLGLETVAGTLVAATHIWNGPGHFQFDDAAFNPKYPTGVPFDLVVEDQYIADTGVTITLTDCDLSVEQLVYLFCMAIKGATASGGTTPFLMDNYALPTSSTINDIKSFTAEFTDGLQEYEAGYVFCDKIAIHGDVDANNGRMLMNAELKGRMAAASTVTPSLGLIGLIEPLNLNAAVFKLDAIGTAFGTHAAMPNDLVAVDINIDPSQLADRSASGRATKDFAQSLFGGEPKITGKWTMKFNADAVTLLANARAGTGVISQLAIPGSGTRSFKANLPLVFTKAPNVGQADRKGIHTVEFDWEAGYSRTTTAQGPQFPVNMSASTTIT